MANAQLLGQYDNAADRWHSTMQRLGFIENYRTFFMKALPVSTPLDHVLDLGTGSGAFAKAFLLAKPATKSLTAVDFSTAMLKQASLNLAGLDTSVQLVKKDLTESSPLDEFHRSADIVLCAHLLEHMERPIELLKSIRSTLTSQGCVCLAVSKPHWCNWMIHWQWKHRFFSENEVTHLAAASGFNVDQVFDFHSGPASRMSRGYVFSPA